MARRLKVEFGGVALGPDEQARLDYWKKFGTQAEPQSYFAAVWIWARVHGFVTLEIDGATPPFGPGPDEYFERELEAIRLQFIK